MQKLYQKTRNFSLPSGITLLWRNRCQNTVDNITSGTSYELRFIVSDSDQGQRNIEANVTVLVKRLSPDDVRSAMPLTLTSHSQSLVRSHSEAGVSVLSRLVGAIQAWAGGGGAAVKVISLQPLEGKIPATRVWLSAVGIANFEYLLLYHKNKLSATLGTSVQDVGVISCHEDAAASLDKIAEERCVGGCWVGLAEHFSVVDANSSAVVGPQVVIRGPCGCTGTTTPRVNSCTPDTCLNGGRCLSTASGSRCICPHGTLGSHCKVLSRYFEGDGEGEDASTELASEGSWAWVPPIPPCTEVHISVEVLSMVGTAALLYSGSDQSVAQGPNMHDVLLLELRQGQPVLLLDLGSGPITLTLNTSLTDNMWHRIDLIWKDELVEMLVDLCLGDHWDKLPASSPAAHNHSSTTVFPDVHMCRGSAKLPQNNHILNSSGVLQVGGIVHPLPPIIMGRDPMLPHPPHFHGCIKNLRINGKLIDLGNSVLSKASTTGCHAADCLINNLYCGPHGRCQGSPGSLHCECQPGWGGLGCASPTTPTTFFPNSYVKLALSFSPLAYTSSFSFRFRTLRRRGELIVLSSQHGRDSWSIQIVDGCLCAVLQLHPQPPTSICLSRAALTDGHWHSLAATRYGSATFLMVDDEDGDLYNASLLFEGQQFLEIDKQEGVRLGGSPHFQDTEILKIDSDYFDAAQSEGVQGDMANRNVSSPQSGCIDDLRISGHSIPLPPAVNSTPWGQASTFKGVEQGCFAPSSCTNVSCRPPLVCVDTWRSYHCGCGEGRVLGRSRVVCEDEDECAWQPCLNGGSCLNTHPVLVCAFLLHQHHRRTSLRKCVVDAKDSSEGCKGQVSPMCSHTPNLLELQLLKPSRPSNHPSWTRNPNIADVDVLRVDAMMTISGGQELSEDNDQTSPSLMKSGQGVKGLKSNMGTTDSSSLTENHLRKHFYEDDGPPLGEVWEVNRLATIPQDTSEKIIIWSSYTSVWSYKNFPGVSHLFVDHPARLLHYGASSELTDRSTGRTWTTPHTGKINDKIITTTNPDPSSWFRSYTNSGSPEDRKDNVV
ncbi:Neural-cadherin [Portunus trituberculatus]|uniref:Neural-cadherin n=1 Tax=Portunus trituberculatus TaxID=210409 RepID=A0A5B7DZD3_PORTR|nr:Neural-cadherin [Portunus trituberculatus]